MREKMTVKIATVRTSGQSRFNPCPIAHERYTPAAMSNNQGQRVPRYARRLALHRDVATEQAGEPLRDRQSEAGSREMTGRGAFHLSEWLEQPADLFAAEADARIPHVKADRPRFELAGLRHSRQQLDAASLG